VKNARGDGRLKTLIDVSQVPEEKRDDPRFQRCLFEIENMLADGRFQNTISVHEAAHVIYFEQAGFTNPVFSRTRILYDPSQDDPYPVYIAEVKFGTENVNRDSLRDYSALQYWILDVSKAHCAGGVAARKIMNELGDVGDQRDYENFLSFCDGVCAVRPDIPIDRDVLWKCAQDEVKQDLSRSGFEQKIWQKVREIKPLLFEAV
jgi:hypothetical protein